MNSLTRTIAIATLLLPSYAFASTTTDFLSEVAGLFYIVVGIVLVISILFMLVGFLLWFQRLGTSGNVLRDRAIKIMQWGVATLFTLVLVVGAVQFVQVHTSATLYVLSVIVIFGVLYALATMEGEKKEEKKGDKPAAH